MQHVFLRIGSLAEIHIATSDTPLRRGRRVIVRTSRGVELGEVLGPCGASELSPTPIRVLRPTTEQDELLIRRLDRHKRRAVEECQRALGQAGCEATLLDVDQLFDGGTLVMHFLGDVDDRARSITETIAGQYESVVQSRHFAKLLSEGCGPTCGTEEGAGGGCSGTCGSCSVGCGIKKR